MKNKIKLKKFLLIELFITICFLILFLLINIFEYKIYTRNFNQKIGSIISIVKQNYPEISETEIIQILNSEETSKKDFFNKYGIDVDTKSILIKNQRDYHKFLVINIAFLVFTISIFVISFILYNLKREKEISEITKCIEQINKKNYELKIDSMSEDELSILKNEIYKTTIMLKEAAENSNNDKLSLKKSLEDISHQIKTPLTSILVMLDNLIDDPYMDTETRNDFIRDIKRNVVNINFLIQALLKLSKFDTNTIHFIRQKCDLKELINDSIKNVSTLCDLKNIRIIFEQCPNSKINCDPNWQIEALTNIIKNAIDHSKENSKIFIKADDNNVYAKIEIIDHGNGISKKDLPHIFERFYKGKNSSSESIGIGLALSKNIIEKDNGTISVESNSNETNFTIKYFKF